LRPLPLSAKPRESPPIGLGAPVGSLGVAPGSSLDYTLDVRGDLVDDLSDKGAFSSDEKLEFRGDLDA
jgi:hypothetical protein